jgi:hypothetical protein
MEYRDIREESAGRSETGLTPERLIELRKRIDSGYHDSPEVIDALARRLVECGDL